MKTYYEPLEDYFKAFFFVAGLIFLGVAFLYPVAVIPAAWMFGIVHLLEWWFKSMEGM